MKRSEQYVNILADEFGLDHEVANEIYKAINKRDWAYFCSYMADYDQPQERRAADKVFKEFVEKSGQSEELINKIADYMKSDERYNIHKMNDEVTND